MAISLTTFLNKILNFWKISTKLCLNMKKWHRKWTLRLSLKFWVWSRTHKTWNSHDDDFIIVRGNHHSLFYWTSITYTLTWFNGLGFVTPVLRVFIKTRPLSLQLMHPILHLLYYSGSLMLILGANKSLIKNIELIIKGSQHCHL